MASSGAKRTGKGSVSGVKREMNKTPVKLSAYILYALQDKVNHGFENRPTDDAMRWKSSMKTDAICKPIKTVKDFVDAWNTIVKDGNKVQYIGLYFHSNPHTLIISAEHVQYMYALEREVTDKGSKALPISKLPKRKKKIENLYLYSCNSGHLSHTNDNLAVTFISLQNIKKVYAWDGSMKWSNCGRYTRLAYDTELFESWRNPEETRVAEGLIMYYKTLDGHIACRTVRPVGTEEQGILWMKRIFSLWSTNYK